MRLHSTKSPLRFGLLAAALWLAAMSSVFAQQYMELPPRSLMGNMKFQSNPGNVVTIPELVAALSVGGMPLDQMTKVGDSIYTMVPSDRAVATLAPLTASRTWTLPLASFVNAGHPILVVDLAGGVSASNKLVITSAGSDTINSGTTATISTAFGAYYLVSDGASRWTAQSMGGGESGATANQIPVYTGSGGAPSLNRRAAGSTRPIATRSALSSLG